MLQTEISSAAVTGKNLSSPSDESRGKENQSSINSSKTKQQFPNSKIRMMKTPVKKPPAECGPASRHSDPQRLQLESQVKVEHQNSKRNHASQDGNQNPKRSHASQHGMSSIDDSPNKISESILKCLMGIFLRMTSHKGGSTAENLPSAIVSDVPKDTLIKDPYSICSKFGNRDIGPYKNLHSIDASSIKPNQTKISVFLAQRLKLLLEKLASVELKGLSHQERLAFWINIYNACMMNAFIEYGIPGSPEMVVELMQKATVDVGGHVLNAITIEHFILRLPYHSKYTFSKGVKHDDTATWSMFGLELSEPLVTFALSCGSWSSPAVRVHTASQVENELETAKREYLQAAVGISTTEKYIAIPKLLDWYLLDFAKDVESLLDWICLQLPCELRKCALKCIEMRKDEHLLQSVRIMPYEFSFRFLLYS